MTPRGRGIIGSILIHILMIVVLVAFGFSTPLPLPGEEGILINFGDSDQGMGMAEPRIQPKEEPTPKVEAPKQEETPITQDYEEAPSLPVTKPKPKPQPEKPKEEAPVDKPEETPREVDRRAMFPGQQTQGGDSDEGDTGKPGNQGDPGGDPNSSNRTGGTVGGGHGISFSLGNREAQSLPQPDYPKQKSGTVVVEVTVDRNGVVTAVRGGVKGSTTYDSDLVTAAEKAARKARFSVSKDAPAFQTGTITYIFKLEQ